MEIKLKELRARGVKIKKKKVMEFKGSPPEPPYQILLRFSFDDADCLWVPRELREIPENTIVTFDEHPNQEYIIMGMEEDLPAGRWILYTSIYDQEEEAEKERWDD